MSREAHGIIFENQSLRPVGYSSASVLQKTSLLSPAIIRAMAYSSLRCRDLESDLIFLMESKRFSPKSSHDLPEALLLNDGWVFQV